jgi:hypothetical protein
VAAGSPSGTAGIHLGAELGGQADHAGDAIDGGAADGFIRVGEVKAVGGEDLAGGDAGDFEAGGGEATADGRDINL